VTSPNEPNEEENIVKFNLGHWRVLPGIEAVFPVSVVDIQIEPDALVVTGYDRPIRARWDYLNGTSITARFSSPMPNVIRVQLIHFKGRQERQPAFDLDYALTHPAVSTGRDEHRAWLNAGGLSVSLPTEGEWRLTFERDGQPLTESEPGAIGLFTQNEKTYLREQLSLQVGETVYGLGEHFGPLVRNGQSIEMWNEDGGTDSEYAYKNVPFYLSNQGYGVLVNHPG
jgi:alpha-D-xyloside xylohydrolase